eukprot:scaffold114733_cov63-Phaeocystis_antarctica.AAC.1
MAGSASVAPQPRMKTTASVPARGSWRCACTAHAACIQCVHTMCMQYTARLREAAVSAGACPALRRGASRRA